MSRLLPIRPSLLILCSVFLLFACLAQAQPLTNTHLQQEIQALYRSETSYAQKKEAFDAFAKQVNTHSPYPIQREMARMKIQLFQMNNQYDESIQAMAELEALAKSHADIDTALLMATKRIYEQHDDSRIDGSIEAIHALQNQLPETPSAELMEAMESSLGNMYMDVGNLQLAVQHQLLALHWSEKLPHNALRRQLYRLNTLADISLLMHLPDDALGYLDRALAMTEADKMPPDVKASLLISRARIYKTQGSFQEAQAFLSQAFAILEPLKNSGMNELLAILEMVEIHIAQQHYDEAKPWLDRIKKIIEPWGYGYFTARYKTLMGAYLVHTGNEAEGFDLIHQSLEYFAESGQPIEVNQVLARKVELLSSKQRYKEALATMNERYQWVESMKQEEIIRAMKELKHEQAMHQQAIDLEKLNTKTRVQALELKHERSNVLLSVATAVIALLAAILLGTLLRRTSKQRDALRFDELTGAYNRHHLHERRKKKASQKHTTGVILIDIDHFKHINDTYGHATGDQVLQNLVNRIQPFLRPTDEVYRWGGEEFLLLLKLDHEDDLKQVVQRLQHAIHSAPMETHMGTSIPITASIGCVLHRKEHSETCPLSKAIEWSDSALYLAKAEGRNCSVLAGLTDSGAAHGCTTPKHMRQLVEWVVEGYAWTQMSVEDAPFSVWPQEEKDSSSV